MNPYIISDLQMLDKGAINALSGEGGYDYFTS